jgi:hypothetical protein
MLVSTSHNYTHSLTLVEHRVVYYYIQENTGFFHNYFNKAFKCPINDFVPRLAITTLPNNKTPYTPNLDETPTRHI